MFTVSSADGNIRTMYYAGGAVVATAGSAFADPIKSLVGEKVAGEYVVKGNGNSLSENAIVVDGKVHVPLRAVTDSLE